MKSIAVDELHDIGPRADLGLENWRADLVETALARHAGSVTALDAARWVAEMKNGRAWPVDVRLDGDWVLFVADVPADLGRRPDEAWLKLNASLAGSVRVARPLSRPARVRADLDLDPFRLSRTTDGLDELCDWLMAAFASADGACPGPAATRVGRATHAEMARALAERCEEAGIPGVTRPAGTLHVALGSLAWDRAAVLTAESDGRVHARAPLARPSQYGEMGRRALALFLLAVGDAIRGARPIWIDEDDVVALDASWPAMPTASALRRGVEALAVGCQMAAREATALADESLASRYVDSVGPGRRPVADR